MPTTKVTKFMSILSRKENKISDERAARWGKNFTKSSQRLVDDAESKVDSIDEKIENMMDISTSNDLQSANRVGDFNAESYAEKLHTLEYELALAVEKLQVAKATHSKYC